jgi:hypothetical protein
MKFHWKHFLVSLLLIGCLTLALPLSGGTAGAIDLTQPCSLTVHPGNFEDLDQADVVFDLYLVAQVESDGIYDTYSYQATPAYTSLSDRLEAQDELDNQVWKELALDAAEITLASGQSISKAVDGASVDTAVEELDCGLYLLIARGADIENYVTTVTDSEGNESIATIAHSDEYVYTFAPELISLPSKAADENGVISTANPGSWLYDMEVTLKPEQAIRFGDLEIVKTVTDFVAGDSATFVFSIEGTINGEVVYSNVAALTFDAAGQQRILLADQIPVGATVTVTEIYSGARYTLSSDATQQTVILNPDEGTASVSFTNTYDGSNRSGNGVINHFAQDENGNWTVDNSRDNAAQ